jgi:two-component system sensor kinase FixL
MRALPDRDSDVSRSAHAALGAELEHARRQVEAQAASIAHYRKMYDRTSALARIGVWEYDLVTDQMSWTDAVYDLFELPRGNPLDRDRILELYRPESRVEMERMRAQAIAEGSGFGLDIRIRTAKGKDRWLRLTVDVEQENGRSVRIFGTKQDITDARSARDKVQSLQTELIHVSRKSAIGAMAATLAHELNQPLAAISNYAAGTRRALAEGTLERAFVEGSLEAIEQSAFRASNIIRGLRDLANEGGARRRVVDPSVLIREAGALAAGAEGATISYALADDVRVLVDPVQLQQVMLNLIRNALEAVENSPRREILVSSRRLDGAAEIRVEDSGPGMDRATLATLFETFASSKPDGMGVGLSISRTIIEAHGGRIWAENREGGGARFRVTLPLALGE